MSVSGIGPFPAGFSRIRFRSPFRFHSLFLVKRVPGDRPNYPGIDRRPTLQSIPRIRAATSSFPLDLRAPPFTFADHLAQVPDRYPPERLVYQNDVTNQALFKQRKLCSGHWYTENWKFDITSAPLPKRAVGRKRAISGLADSISAGRGPETGQISGSLQSANHM
jgi:hypothetical protein